jgi:hypothetical protein
MSANFCSGLQLRHDPLGRADGNDVDGDPLLYLKLDHPVNHQIENLVGVLDINDRREMDVLRLIVGA